MNNVVNNVDMRLIRQLALVYPDKQLTHCWACDTPGAVDSYGERGVLIRHVGRHWPCRASMATTS